MRILVVNGPNLQLLGKRKPDTYGRNSLKDVEKMLGVVAKELGVKLEFFQSCVEGEIVEKIGGAGNDGFDGIVINPAAYTHTSVAIRDAIEASALPAIEVHISNVHKRENFRRVSLTAPVCVGQICGLGIKGYEWALRALLCVVKEKKS
ncbi:MAG TPA: type II 3-dehydroquinate dehydratase [Victivallales bacterium]|nr:type II 3-dehydroquinate dehydratase [Victivallales bacterium]